MIAPVVDAAWTAAHLGEVVLADVRWYLDGRPGRPEYDRGHLPGAVFVELDDWLAAPASPEAGRHPLPDPEVFARGMGELGIGDTDTVIAYDDQGGVIAARLAWLLRVTGHEAAVLDGGIAAWDGPLETGPAAPPAHDLHATALATRGTRHRRRRGRPGQRRHRRPPARALSRRRPPTRSTPARATSQEPEASTPASTSAPTAACCRSKSSDAASPRPASTEPAPSSPTAAPE